MVVTVASEFAVNLLTLAGSHYISRNEESPNKKSPMEKSFKEKILTVGNS